MREYVVKEGDTLGGVAAREMGAAHRWPKLFQVNREAILAEQKRRGLPQTVGLRTRTTMELGPDWIFPGTILHIPLTPSRSVPPQDEEATTGES